MQDERWLPIAGKDGYEVSDLGRVKSYRRSGGPHLMKGYRPAPGQRLRVTLCGPGEVRRATVSRLELEAFVGPAPTEWHQGHHINGKMTDDRLENLAWKTPSEISLRSVELGKVVNPNRVPRGKDGPPRRGGKARDRIPDQEKAGVRRLHAASMPVREIARRLELTVHEVKSILHRV